MCLFQGVYITLIQNPQLIRIAVCTSDYLIKFRITLRSYMAILLLVLFVLTFLVLRTTMSAFRREGTLSFVVMSVALFPLPVMDVIHTIATTGDLFAKTMVHLWIEFTQGVLFPLLIMSVLFLPNVSVPVFYVSILSNAFLIHTCKYLKVGSLSNNFQTFVSPTP